ncbi:MAG TPA: ATP-binding protein [Aquabacterium sp.]|uniref:ATP-binding protein n=1 Tax=Aquabacterium sp. TaxID=1872578 RepID=UPI002E2EE238|nr:ATP-binding protein [Aquabacterium sp.]HEX5372031.1 ATP-binding protein [Aquabacterium sp.]
MASASVAESRDLDVRVVRELERASHEVVPRYILFGWVLTLGVLWILQRRLPVEHLAFFAFARLVMGTIRWRNSLVFLAREPADQHSSLPVFRLLVGVDGVTWGMLGWWLTPLQNLEVAAVTIGVMIAVSALGTFMLQIDRLAAALFIVPILLPNGIYALTRHDDLGVFCALSLFGMLMLLLRESRHSHRRMSELMRLRFQSEQVAHAQSQALTQARLLSETKSRFLATMSHEMRTPLHGILGLVRLLLTKEQDPQSLKQLTLIRGSGHHLINVINDVLDFSAMESGSLPLHEQRFDLHDLLTEVADTSQVAATDKGLTLTLALDIERGVDVMGDPVRLRQVLHNLLGNAIKFTHEGEVSLRATRERGGQMVRIEVQDTGIGIAPDDLAHVFDAFYQAEDTYRRHVGGTGLGLTISRDLCRAMGGDMSCRSTPGQGSVFTFLLPLPVLPDEPIRADTLPATMAELDGQVHHVLLVEDNPVNALVAEAELQRLGMTVTVKDNGREALEWLTHQQADLVLMDCEMPDMDGFEATRRIRAHERATGRAPVSIVALTANGLETYVQRCMAAGMDDHLAKPFRPEDLMRLLARHLGLALKSG